MGAHRVSQLCGLGVEECLLWLSSWVFFFFFLFLLLGLWIVVQLFGWLSACSVCVCVWAHVCAPLCVCLSGTTGSASERKATRLHDNMCGSGALLHMPSGVWEPKEMCLGRGASGLAPQTIQEFVCFFLSCIFLLPAGGCILPGKSWQWNRSYRTERVLV